MGECPGRCHARLRRFHLTFSRRLLAKDAKRRTSKSSHQRAHQPHSPFSCHFHLLWDSRRLYPGNCSKLCLTSLTLRICHKISQHIPRFLNFSENCSFCSSWYWAFDHPIQNRRRMEFIFYKNPCQSLPRNSSALFFLAIYVIDVSLKTMDKWKSDIWCPCMRFVEGRWLPV